MPSRSRPTTAPPKARRRPRRQPPKPAKPRSFLWRWRRGLFLVGLLLVASVAGTGFVLAQIPLPPEDIPAQTTFICFAEVTANCNQDNAAARLFGEQDRVSVTLDQIPQVVIDAVLAAEDRDFFNHPGVDPVGILRAAYQDIRHRGEGSSTQGGSTITQQYVKLTRLTTERTFTRKIKEAVLSIKLEQELSKQEILERYLNLVYFGRGAYGVGTASRTYFGHDLSEITLPEAAFLAGLIRGPEAADPVRDPEEASRRRRTVLDAMVATQAITPEQRDAADAVPWIVGDPAVVPGATVLDRTQREGFGDVAGQEFGTKYFVEYVRRQLLAHGFTDAEIYGGGLRVYTTLDLQAQQAAYEAIQSNLDRPDDPLASLVAVDASGAVRAMVGGTNFDASEVNLAVGTEGGGSGQQAGSAFKPFVLATAIANGVSLNSKFDAAGHVTLPLPGDDWRVSNYGGTEEGVLTLVEATRVSSNTAYAQLMLDDHVGPERAVAMAHRLGITSTLQPFPSLVLGAQEVSPLEMADAYSSFGRQGEHVDPLVITRVERADGSVVTFPQAREQVLSPAEDAQVVYALRQVVSGGTGQAARLSVPVAGKTGTTQDNADAWFVGFLPNAMTAAVWMGYDPVDLDGDGTLDARYMNSVHGRTVTGGSFPAEIWHDFMSRWVDIVGGDVGSFPSADPAFPGTIINADLSTTTSSLPTCGTTTSAGGPTTAPCAPPTTRSPCGPPPSDAAATTAACTPTTAAATTATTTGATDTTLPPTTVPPTTLPPTTLPPTTPTTAPPTTPATLFP